MKRKIISICVSLAITGGLISLPAYNTIASAAISYNSTSIDANLNATATPDHIDLSWTNDPTTTQTIAWRTISTDKRSYVQFRVKGSSTWATSPDATPKALTSGTGDITVTTGTENIYSITLTELTSGTTYEYQIVALDATNTVQTSSISSFKTESSNNKSAKFIVFGDSQSGVPANPEYTPWNHTITEAYQQNPDANFVVNMGDLVEIGQSYQHWNNWFSAANGVINNIPEMPVQGNHETYINNTENSSSAPQDFTNQFSVPQNGPLGHVGQTYSYNYGNVHFVVLDSQEDEEAPGKDSFLQEQASWLENDLSKNVQKWTIVMFHKTPYYNKATRNNPAVKDIFTPIIEKHHVDIVFNGHDHGISRTYPINNGNYYTDYSKGTVYYVTGRSGNKYYTDLNKKIWDAAFFDCQDSPAYEVVNIENGKLTIDAYKYNTIDTSATNKQNVLCNTPTKIDSFTIDKDNPGNSTQLTLNPSKSTQLAIAGTVQDGYNVTVSNNKGYIDPALIAKYYKGTYDATSLTLTINNKAYTFAKTDLLNGDSSKVNIDALYTQGIDVSYNNQLNCILVDFTGRITPDMIAAFKDIKL
ncbi:metallophosphoesterase family protein [Clostridium sp.]|uniref:metallophosphoesterase family protein n=1 Tax=Clostridium sp. TaxID=1506 RepID=UPI00284F83B7|nr:metallophosphoesterase family protein [Clostridium sp.]MDR3596403.1 metallophosphoesterase family protein [Clostridium sp.]